MADGALSTAAPAYNGGFASSAPPPLTAASSDPNLMFQKLAQMVGPEQAMNLAPAYGIQFDPKYADALLQQSQELRGSGPLSQQVQAMQSKEEAAAAEKKMAIQQAMQVLQQQQQGRTNLPLLAASAALGAPTKTGLFSESLSNAMAAAVPVTEAQRKQQLGEAETMGTLGTAAADTDLAQAKDESADFWKRIQQSNYDLGRAGMVGERGQANALNNNTKLATNAATNAARDRATAVRGAYEASIVQLRDQGLDEKTVNDAAMRAAQQQLIALSGGKLSEQQQKDWASAVSREESGLALTMQGMSMSPSERFALAVQNVSSAPASAWGRAKPLTPAAPAAPGQKPQTASGDTPQRPPLSDIFNPPPTQ